MSSEESDYDEHMGGKIFWKKTLPWRRDIERELRYIESNSKNGPPGNTMRKDAHGEQRDSRKFIVSTRDAKGGMPRSLYDEAWIRDQEEWQITQLAIPDYNLEWPDVTWPPS